MLCYVIIEYLILVNVYYSDDLIFVKMHKYSKIAAKSTYFET